jgi:hypothetical protein
VQNHVGQREVVLEEVVGAQDGERDSGITHRLLDHRFAREVGDAGRKPREPHARVDDARDSGIARRGDRGQPLLGFIWALRDDEEHAVDAAHRVPHARRVIEIAANDLHASRRSRLAGARHDDDLLAARDQPCDYLPADHPRTAND